MKNIAVLILLLLGSAQAADVPENFNIEIFAPDVEGARQMALSDSGIIYAGTRKAGKVYAIEDTDGDYKADNVYTIIEDLYMPSGVTYHDGDLYVAEVDKILRFKDIDKNYKETPEPEVVYDNLPDKSHHGWKYIKFGPDGRLYIPIGVPCNVCDEEDKRFGTIISVDLETKEREFVATGVRNSVGFDWHPVTGELWFTDNGRDWLGDDEPACELNKVSESGEFFGFPYIHGEDFPDPAFGEKLGDREFTAPEWEFQAHVAPLGMHFYTGEMFPASYKNSIFVTQHGSWNRSTKVGYKVVRLTLEDNKVVSQEDFITGWLVDGEVKGRPNDVIQLPDGSLLVSDDGFGKIYRVTYQK
ncbi:PQQ-dependent sugar dehydrogenase [Kangiella sediminilitoris]|uniref:NHL repeat containing protein n=1 Tax=Kangiella sediminilitoris TaxID=1144748 RepID=A0A1B3BCH3_9GAMM|nr:sorbosone dehydrogenase family protein [Kangiella sediminilitoris]AOE50437.1 NHL repeat containing protein [Kangiella sediminilitoris]